MSATGTWRYVVKFVPVCNQANSADRIPRVLRRSRKSRGWRVDRYLSWTQIAVYGVTDGMRKEQTIIRSLHTTRRCAGPFHRFSQCAIFRAQQIKSRLRGENRNRFKDRKGIGAETHKGTIPAKEKDYAERWQARMDGRTCHYLRSSHCGPSRI